MSVQARIDALENQLQALSKDVANDEQARKRLVLVTQQATAMVETPSETIWKMLFQVDLLSEREEQDLKQDIDEHKPHLNASIRTALEMGLFHALSENENAKTATELASITGGDKLLIGKPISVLLSWIPTTNCTQSAF